MRPRDVTAADLGTEPGRGGELAEYAEALCRVRQVRPELVVSTILGTLSALCAGKALIDVKGEWAAPLALWTVCVQESGERKSPVVGDIVRPLREAVRELNEQTATQRRQHNGALADLEKREKALSDALAKSKADHDRAAYRSELEDVREELEKTEAWHELRLLVDDITPEALGQLLDRHPALAFISAEGGPLDQARGAFNAREMATRLDVYLKGYDGEALSTGRVGRGEVHLEMPWLSFALAVQPDVVNRALGSEELSGRGFLARFLLWRPDSMVGKRDETLDEKMPDHLKAVWATRVRELAAWAYPQGDLPVIQLTEESKGIVIQLAVESEKLQLPGKTLDLPHAWGSKYVGQVMRIAGLLHCWQHGPAAVVRPVEAETLVRAQGIGTKALAHFREMTQQAERITVNTPEEQRIVRATKKLQEGQKRVAHDGQAWARERDVFHNVRGGRITNKPDFDGLVANLLEDEAVITTESGSGAALIRAL